MLGAMNNEWSDGNYTNTYNTTTNSSPLSDFTVAVAVAVTVTYPWA